jgi:hypothetical protein
MFVQRALLAVFGFTAAWVAIPAFAAEACSNRGELDAMYCDANKDLVADVPTDPKKWKDPSTIVFTYTPVEDPAVYENIFKPFTTYLSKCLDKKVVFYPGPIECRGNRGYALRPLARRRLFDRSDRVRGQSSRRNSIRSEGNREGISGLQLDRDRQGELAVSETRRSQR